MDAVENVIELEPIDNSPEAEVVHDDLELTPAEAEEGQIVWLEVDDLNDQSNGVDDEDDEADVVSGRFGADVRQLALTRARIVRDCLLRHGVPEVSIELMEGRPSGGDDWNACRPVAHMSHHIVSRPTAARPTPGLALVKQGRSDLPGPLCNGTAGVDLVYRIVTLGFANHPGFGGPLLVRGPMGSYVIPKDNGRGYIWGTEYEGGLVESDWDHVYHNRRTGQSMTFREFMGRVNAGMAEAIWLINGLGKVPGRNSFLGGYLIEHKTWAPDRKVDRAGYTTDSGRAEARPFMRDMKPRIYYPTVRLASEGKIRRETNAVRRVQKCLRKYDANLVITGRWNKHTEEAFRKFERTLKKEESPNGVPGPHEVVKLAGDRFEVTGLK